MGFWRHSGNTSVAFTRIQLYNLVVYLAIFKHTGRGKKPVFPMYNSSEMQWELEERFRGIRLRNNKSVSCIIAPCSGAWIWRSKKQFSSKKRLIYAIQSFINIRYFFNMENWCAINMEISKHSRSSISQHTASLYKYTWHISYARMT